MYRCCIHGLVTDLPLKLLQYTVLECLVITGCDPEVAGPNSPFTAVTVVRSRLTRTGSKQQRTAKISGMGCGVSHAKESMSIGAAQPFADMAVSKPDQGLKLTPCKMDLTAEQLGRANSKFLRILEQNSPNDSDKRTARLRVVVERLVQRLVCSVGHLDNRFASKFLISLDPIKKKGLSSSSIKLHYFVRLDALSTPSLYGEPPPVRIIQGTGRDTLPAGFAKLRVHGEYLEQWGDLINPQGFLRRDKVQERFMELLATSAGQPGYPMSPTEVDESRYCGAPGKVVDPLTLHHILKLPPEEQCFHGSAECDETRFPDPRDFRIAIVEGIPEIRLHISFLSPAAHTTADEGAEIVLIICVGVADWPQQSDFPFRLPLDHCDVLMGYKAAQTGYYIVPNGPHHSMRCEDRSAVWEIQVPAARTMLQHHYSDGSVVHRCCRVLSILKKVLQSRGMKTINGYTLETLQLWEMERNSKLEDWTASRIAYRVVSILNTLAECLRNGMLRGYFIAAENLLLQPCIAEEDYKSDADILEAYLAQFYHDRGGYKLMDDGLSVQDQLETVIICKWNYLINSLSRHTNRERRLSLKNKPPSPSSYSRRQMEYIAVLFGEMLKLHQIQHTKDTPQSLPMENAQDQLDDFFYLLHSVFEQAKTRAWNNACGEGRRRLRQVMDSYDVSTAMIIDSLKQERRAMVSFDSDMQLVAKVIECLHTAVDSDGKVLGVVIRPYLNQIFRGSQQNCWFLAEWLKRMDTSEFEAVGAVSRLMVTEHLDPLQGLLDSVSKGWNWAKDALYMLKAASDEETAQLLLGHRIDNENSGIRLILTPGLGQMAQYTVRLTDAQSLEVAEYLREQIPGRTPLSTLRKGKKADPYATIRSFPDTLCGNGEDDNRRDTWCKLRAWSEKQPPHDRLRDGSPLTVISMAGRRFGTHRGIGGIVQALISLHKLSVLQDVSKHLPEGERDRVLADIQKLSKEVQRMSVTRHRSESYVNKARFSFRKAAKSRKTKGSSSTVGERRKWEIREQIPTEAYRSRNEFLQEVNVKRPEIKQRELPVDSLLGTCRQLRNQHRIHVETIDYASGMATRYGLLSQKSSQPTIFPKHRTLPAKSNEMTEI